MRSSLLAVAAAVAHAASIQPAVPAEALEPLVVGRDDRPWHGRRTRPLSAASTSLLAADDTGGGGGGVGIENVLFGVMTSKVHGRRARAVKATWCGAERVKCVFFSETAETAMEVQPVVVIQDIGADYKSAQLKFLPAL